MPTPAIIDLSHHNLIPSSLIPAKASGVQGVIHKASEGTTFADSKYSARRYLAQEAGLLWGSYHFLRPGKMLEQAKHFLAVSEPDDNTLLAADHEDKGVSLDDLIYFLATIEDRIGREPIVYSGHVLKEQMGGQPNPDINQYRLWLAQYGSTYELPPGWPSYWLWQYSDKGQVPGISEYTDVNDYLGTNEELAAEWAGGSLAPPLPPPPSITTIVKLQVPPSTAPSTITLFVPNGTIVELE